LAHAIPRWDRRTDPKSVGRFVALTPLICSPQTAVVIALRPPETSHRWPAATVVFRRLMDERVCSHQGKLM